MKPALHVLASEQNRALWAWLGTMLLCIFMIPAGGLGLAAAAGLFALAALPLHTLVTHLRKPELVTLLAIATIAWSAISYTWSAYRDPDEVLKLALLTPFFILVPVAAAQIRPADLTLARAAFLMCVASILSLMAIEAITGGDLTRSYKLDVEGYDPARTDINIRVDLVLSRGATPAIMLAGIAAILLWSHRIRTLQVMAALAAILTVLLALAFSVQANAAALAAAVIVAACCCKWPMATLRLVLAGFAVLILTGPLLFAGLLTIMGPEFGQALPMSWEWRLEIWNFALEKIAQAPLAGHGIGASRVLGETTSLRGHSISLLPLHAHNASLTVWLETGLIGAGLLSATLIALAATLRRIALAPRLAMMLGFAITVWAVNVFFSYGIWQEWHHGALALAIAAAFISRPAP
ncbi:MAG: O-antigen ligase family protein [Oceanicaulis sp. HLUCCA04]|nr:MAG: O-antigen ligase family protein [Oceanicaulis sp. HLUCCA04]